MKKLFKDSIFPSTSTPLSSIKEHSFALTFSSTITSMSTSESNRSLPRKEEPVTEAAIGVKLLSLFATCSIACIAYICFCAEDRWEKYPSTTSNFDGKNTVRIYKLFSLASNLYRLQH